MGTGSSTRERRATCVVCELFTNFRRLSVDVLVAKNGVDLKAVGEGEVFLYVATGQKICLLKLQNVLFVPDLSANMISVHCMDQMGLKSVFQNEICKVLSPTNEIVFEAPEVFSGIYMIKVVKNFKSHFLKPNLYVNASAVADKIVDKVPVSS